MLENKENTLRVRAFLALKRFMIINNLNELIASNNINKMFSLRPLNNPVKMKFSIVLTKYINKFILIDSIFVR